MMRLGLKNPYRSIHALDSCELTDFAVLIGRNGVGKSQLLNGIAERQILSFVHPEEIEKYDISSFRTQPSEPAYYGGSLFAERTAQRFFNGAGDRSPSELAQEIFDITIDQFDLGPGTDGRTLFENSLRPDISRLQFESVGVRQVNISDRRLENVEKAVEHYTREIAHRVVAPLAPEKAKERHQQKQPSGCNNDPAILVSMAMKLTGKLAHEIDRNDILRAAHLEGDTFSNSLSQVFTRYKAEQYSWAITESERGNGDVGRLIDNYRQKNKPPWVILREVLDNMRTAAGGEGVFNFEFSDPEADRLNHADHTQYSFQTVMTNRTTGESYGVESLSSGEAILMTLCMAWLNQSMGRKRPGLILLDEVDAMLHPSMVGALVSCLKELFVQHGTKVMIASHCPATVAILEEEEIFRVSRDGGQVCIRPTTRSEAVEELSDGMATLDTGIRIATADEKPVMIVTEGHNAKILKRWAALYFPEDVFVFDRLPHRTGDSQLRYYALILSKMEPSSRLLFVWDCDQAGKNGELEKEIGSNTRVATHVLLSRENNIADRGIENKFDEDVLMPYVEVTRDKLTDEILRQAFRKNKKTEFADHIFQHGTKDDFRHFQDLHTIVSQLVKDERRKRSGITRDQQE